ncbi:MAG: pirin family protein [Pacificimonas sp.]
MIEHRPFASLGHANHGWLDAHHHFSFAGYHDPARMGWGALRVWNDDRIAAGAGFPPHGHRDMEIVTFARDGAISHKDSLGNVGRTVAGDVQVMSAGRGIQHSEFNREAVETGIFQIWIEPRETGAEPRWATREFRGTDGLVVLASGYETDADALPIRADARLLSLSLGAGETATLDLSSHRHAYIVGDSGSFTLGGIAASARDGFAVRDEAGVEVTADEDARLLIVQTV